jgi:hypothetical protein
MESGMTDFAQGQSASTPEPRRILWVVNHRTLMPAEVPILRSLGWEVFVPKVIPDHDLGYRSAAITYEYDALLALPKTALRVLNQHNFYERIWAPTVEDIVNRHFDAIVTHFSYYTTSLSEAARKFHGLVVARAFGREHPRSYSDFASIGPHKNLLSELEALGDRFVFGQGYDNLADIEVPEIRRRAHTITVPLPAEYYRHKDSWKGGGAHAVFVCPAINSPYYGDIYRSIKRDFGDVPHVIFGRQVAQVNDPAVLPYLTDADLLALYAAAPVFVYPHVEPRHVHYSPLEAMVVGTPTLYLRGALIDMLTGYADLPGACSNVGEMRAKARRLLCGDLAMAEEIRATQGQVLDAFVPDLARRQWAEVLLGAAPSTINAL